MRRWPAAVILIILLSAFPSCATAGYTVMPAGDYISDRPPQDMTPIEWWQVPPQILITSLLIGTAPELVVVANVLLLLNVWLFFATAGLQNAPRSSTRPGRRSTTTSALTRASASAPSPRTSG
ncbi:hypothetical protein [Methanoculleus chikugoensis]|uniref:hypothetical protein n=1 Tax=Methanoculleus chikugoensis TaxID=118126 RepID=UPI0006D116C7|nr:hypothetical protein [Methanoculleus chikugoensis]